ncbi:MAG: gliding motility-associated peptidyl-prolyl isomerase [Patiriisocius sp.]|jgi:gliding motility-associated peptidyl-prolyl isomerase
MTRIFITLLTLFVTLLACTSPEARRPIKATSGSFYTESAERNRKIFEGEKSMIEALIKNDSLQEYLTSESGFWYYFNNQDTTQIKEANIGDLVTFTYNIKKLDGSTVISTTENGIISYKVDQSNQDLISGIRDGIKLLKEGETATFIFPSYKAFGYYGIEKKLGTNIPVRSTINLISINQNQNN